MTDNPQPTIEELQNQILELKQQNEQNASKIQELETANNKLNTDLGEARSLNAKLFKTLPAGQEGNNQKEEEHQETPEEFLDSFIEPAIKKLGKR